MGLCVEVWGGQRLEEQASQGKEEKWSHISQEEVLERKECCTLLHILVLLFIFFLDLVYTELIQPESNSLFV